MADSEIEFFNRYSGEIETEEIFGGGLLRWAYETGPGRVLTEGIFKRAFFSRLYGAWAKRKSSRKQIPDFVERFGLSPEEFADPVDSFSCFNDFFVRKLKAEARPIDSGAAVIFPADGRHLGFQDLSTVDGIFAKGQRFSLTELLGGDTGLAERFSHGSAVISRLCPVDYHRFHFPVSGRISDEPRLMNGPLYSVNPIALRRRIEILAENKRVLTRVESGDLGTVLILEIGATNVGSIVQTAAMPGDVKKGEEKGFFEFGGSMTMTFFEPDRVRLAADLTEHTAAGREIYARMGDAMA